MVSRARCGPTRRVISGMVGPDAPLQLVRERTGVGQGAVRSQAQLSTPPGGRGPCGASRGPCRARRGRPRRSPADRGRSPPRSRSPRRGRGRGPRRAPPRLPRPRNAVRPDSLIRSRLRVTVSSIPAIAARAVSLGGARGRCPSAGERLLRSAFPPRYSTRPATSSAAIESACGCPARTSTSPIRTAIEPTRSRVKCSAFALRAALECLVRGTVQRP